MLFGRSIRVKRRPRKKLLPDTCNGKVTTFDDNDAELTYCHNCRCVCAEEDGKSSALRTLSLRPQLSDIKNNMQVFLLLLFWFQKNFLSFLSQVYFTIGNVRYFQGISDYD